MKNLNLEEQLTFGATDTQPENPNRRYGIRQSCVSVLPGARP